MKKDKIEYKTKQKLYIFDLDGCIANSDNFVLTNQQAYEKDPDIRTRKGLGFRDKLTKDTKNQFSDAYMIDHQSEIEPYEGIFDLFVRLAQVTNVAILTARPDYMHPCTIQWIKDKVIEHYSEQIFRRMSYLITFNENKEKSLVYKKRIIEEYEKSYRIALIIDDHPEIVEYAKSKDIVCLSPATGYKNLNGNDLTGEKNARKRVSRNK